MGYNPSLNKGPKKPVEMTRWRDVVLFCNALSLRMGLDEVYTIQGTTVGCDWSKKGYRLSTESEWDFAARAGIKSNGYEHAGSDVVQEVGWFKKNSLNKTHDVGLMQPNELGLYDMSGNVSEFVLDIYSPYTATANINPKGGETGSAVVVRGGAFHSASEYLDPTYRLFAGTMFKHDYVGCRVVLPAFID